jgi:hypothetical protein
MATKRHGLLLPRSFYDKPKTPSYLPENIDPKNITELERERLGRRFLAGINKSDTALDYDPTRDEPATINFEQLLLEKIDTAAQTEGVTRDAWIAAACLLSLEQSKV